MASVVVLFAEFSCNLFQSFIVGQNFFYNCLYCIRFVLVKVWLWVGRVLDGIFTSVTKSIFGCYRSVCVGILLDDLLLRGRLPHSRNSHMVPTNI